MINRIVISRLAVSCWLLGFAKIVLSFRTDVRNLFNYYIMPHARVATRVLRSKNHLYFILLCFALAIQAYRAGIFQPRATPWVTIAQRHREPCMGGIKK